MPTVLIPEKPNTPAVDPATGKLAPEWSHFIDLLIRAIESKQDI